MKSFYEEGSGRPKNEQLFMGLVFFRVAAATNGTLRQLATVYDLTTGCDKSRSPATTRAAHGFGNRQRRLVVEHKGNVGHEVCFRVASNAVSSFWDVKRKRVCVRQMFDV